MRSVLIAGVSAAALALGGCSMFQSDHSRAANPGTQTESTAQVPSGSEPSVRTNQPDSPRPVGHSDMSSRAMPSADTSSRSAQTDMARSGTSRPHHMRGARHEVVKEAQLKLKSIGLYTGNIDGLAGPETKQAVSQFQQRNGLKQTGRLDHETLAKLDINKTGQAGSSMPDTTNAQSGTAAPGASK